MSDTDKRLILRNRTRDHHQELDALVGEFSDTLAYERYVVAMAAFRTTVERCLASVTYPSEFNSWRPTLISNHLQQDLADLGRLAPIRTHIFPKPEDRESLIGVLYVLEGSSLGARLLSRRASALGYSAEYGARHLTAQTSSLQTWQSFLSLLNDSVWADPLKAVRAAELTFQTAINAFSDVDRHRNILHRTN